ncbi:MAG: DNA primase [bacterium]|nr:DNA primase [bacterium]
MASPIEEIKSRLDIADVVGGYVKLQKAGANLRARCPFHAEKTPSFFVSPARQSWHCFGGCSKGGDMFKFVMEIEGMEFGEALKLLAHKAGVELTRYEGSMGKVSTERTRLQELSELAAQFFETQLASSQKGNEAKEYLAQRGMSVESVKKWRLGYAPGNGKALIDFLSSRGYSMGEISRAGLTAQSNNSSVDRFRSRIMFPVFDLSSQVIGFGGRIFGEKEKEDLSKYINTPNTPLYDKSRVLYGLDKARVALHKADSCVLVEGYMDVIMVSQAGFENVVASSGTALTPLQLKLLKRYTENLSLAFDMDSAGDNATKRGIELAIESGFSIKVVSMPQGKDPADVASEQPSLWKELCEGAGSILDFYFASALAKFDKSLPEHKRKISQELLPMIKRIPNSIEQSHWVQKLAKELEVSEQTIREELLKVRVSPLESKEEALVNVPVKKTRKELLEERFLLLLFRNPGLLSELDMERIAFLPASLQEMVAGILKAGSLDVAKLESVFPEETLNLLRYLAMKAEVEEDVGQTELEFRSCLLELELLDVRKKLDMLSVAIRSAEQQNDAKKLEALMKEFEEISRSLK